MLRIAVQVLECLREGVLVEHRTVLARRVGVVTVPKGRDTTAEEFQERIRHFVVHEDQIRAEAVLPRVVHTYTQKIVHGRVEVRLRPDHEGVHTAAEVEEELVLVELTSDPLGVLVRTGEHDEFGLLHLPTQEGSL